MSSLLDPIMNLPPALKIMKCSDDPSRPLPDPKAALPLDAASDKHQGGKE